MPWTMCPAPRGAVPLDFRVGEDVVERRLKASIVVNGADLYTGAALSGLGIVQVPRYRVEPELSQGLLRELMVDHPPPPMPVSVLHPQNRQLSARVRVFTQWLAEQFEPLRSKGRQAG